MENRIKRRGHFRESVENRIMPRPEEGLPGNHIELLLPVARIDL